MTGASMRHNLIAANVIGDLQPQLRQEVFDLHQRR